MSAEHISIKASCMKECIVMKKAKRWSRGRREIHLHGNEPDFFSPDQLGAARSHGIQLRLDTCPRLFGSMEAELRVSHLVSPIWIDRRSLCPQQDDESGTRPSGSTAPPHPPPPTPQQAS
ncbi:unnamed protein product [Pleuronectes platessa]|uniref:Uncharacterized protein n=1 Tax=Pleuronectes platessa TaxID=8262 RepID=A0A9N7TLW0_PLEPL|nr:unnamed protein product [Pleuronectes platessa]